VVDCAFESFSFWTLERWDNPLSDGLYLSRETCNTMVYLLELYVLNSCLWGGGSLF
jgi:hypothetical protein